MHILMHGALRHSPLAGDVFVTLSVENKSLEVLRLLGGQFRQMEPDLIHNPLAISGKFLEEGRFGGVGIDLLPIWRQLAKQPVTFPILLSATIKNCAVKETLDV